MPDTVVPIHEPERDRFSVSAEGELATLLPANESAKIELESPGLVKLTFSTTDMQEEVSAGAEAGAVDPRPRRDTGRARRPGSCPCQPVRRVSEANPRAYITLQKWYHPWQWSGRRSH